MKKYYSEVEANLDTFTQPGEARTALAVMDELRVRQLYLNSAAFVLIFFISS